MAITNPRHHMTATDMFTLRLSPSQIRRVGTKTDEELLARMTKGFFGGWIFLPELALFRLLLVGKAKDRTVGFSALEPEIIPDSPFEAKNAFMGIINTFSSSPSGTGPTRVWKPEDIPTKALLPDKAILYGGFQVVDHRCPSIPPALSDDVPLAEQIGSWVDISFGSDTAPFTGCHRLEVLRPRRRSLGGPEQIENSGGVIDIHADSEEESQVVLRLSHFRLNPIVNQPSPVEGLKGFHFVYARLLFEDSVRRVLGP
ncbi:hypothetical protein FIBSPDRAFT_863487 [Athelia psychrophila]|uniref:Uncharacterized protein n=1 Tax=Athelia psychrophila TaxID=1759441 RepID=A0A166HC52_9AGAM|nr:hypothetical protein FIBSPDRAFT_863487 [Fibularhizoctonia sp. CBS 109695]